MTGRAAPHPRKLYWRYKAGSQRAIRDGDWKYLRIAGNEFLFDVVKDPRERANLKDRQKDVFDRLKSDWEAWNDTMLPERATPAAYSNPGNFVADITGYRTQHLRPRRVALPRGDHLLVCLIALRNIFSVVAPGMLVVLSPELLPGSKNCGRICDGPSPARD